MRRRNNGVMSRASGRVIVGALAALAMAGPAFAEEPEPEKPKLGLVLPGGGARGIAHLGVIRVLEELAIVPSLIIGADTFLDPAILAYGIADGGRHRVYFSIGDTF